MYCILSFILLYIILDLFDHIDEILRQKVGMNILARYYLSFIPFIFVQTAPVATLLSTLYILSGLNKNNEIIAMKANGISTIRIITPFLILGLIISILIFLVNDKVVSQSSLIFTTIKEEEIKKSIVHKKEKILSDVTFYGTKNRLFYIKTYDVAKATLKDVIILTHDKRNAVRSKIIAREAQWEGDKWRFYDATIYSLNEKGKIIGEPINYAEKIIDIEEEPKDFQRRQREPTFMSFYELKNYISKFEDISPQTIRKLLVDLYYKVSFPFVNLVILLIGIPFGLMTKMRGGLLRGIGTSIAIVFPYYCLMAVSYALGKAGILPPLLSAWIANIVFGAGGIILIAKVR